MGYNHDDPNLKAGAGGLTVWTLQEMAGDRRFDELNELFNNGLTMNSLPVGLAAGAAARVLDLDNKVIAEALDALTGKNWRGKVFFTSNNKRASEGRNRIRASLLLPNSPIVPMCKFDTMLLDSHPLTPEVKSNLVILNYSDPRTRPYMQELALTKIQVYDIQVAVDDLDHQVSEQVKRCSILRHDVNDASGSGPCHPGHRSVQLPFIGLAHAK